MKKYIGTKEVMAEPMNEGDAFKNGWVRGLACPCGYCRDGYHVQYKNPDGSVYDSWSPKDVFESAYKKADDFKDRLLIEYEELASKIRKLALFGKGGFRKKVGLVNAVMMHLQLLGMTIYVAALMVRMDNLKISYTKFWKYGK